MRTGRDDRPETFDRAEMYALIKVFMREALKTAIDRHEHTGCPIEAEMIRAALIQHIVDPRGCGREIGTYLEAAMTGDCAVPPGGSASQLAVAAALEMGSPDVVTENVNGIVDDIVLRVGDGGVGTCFCDDWDDNLEAFRHLTPLTPIQAIAHRVVSDMG
jgi:hypothetical protein